MLKKIIVILGPTGSGKSALALKLAKKFNGYLISADSRQVYKQMNIGTNKDKGLWRENKYFVSGIEECLVDFLDLNKLYSVNEWVRQAKEEIISHKNKLPIIVGGTGLYISALIDNYELPGFNAKIRVKVAKEYEQKGLSFILARLKKIDPSIEQKIDTSNPRRVLRAYEICLLTKKPLNNAKKKRAYDSLQIGIDIDRQKLHAKLDKRCKQQFDEGLVSEVQNILKSGCSDDIAPLSGIGYRHVIRLLNKEINQETALSLNQRDNRRYAKRQMTWFRRDKRIHWVKTAVKAMSLAKRFLNQ